MKGTYVRLLFLDMSKFKSLNRFTRKSNQKLKKCFVIEKDVKVNYSHLLIGWIELLHFY